MLITSPHLKIYILNYNSKMAEETDTKVIQSKGDLDIFFVIGSLQIGGAERHLLQITPELRRNGFKLCIYCLSRRDVLASQFEAQGVDVIAPPFASLKNASPRCLRPLFLFLSLCKLWWELKRRHPVLCHFFLPEAYVLGAPIAWLAGCRTLVMSRRSLNVYQRNRHFLTFFEKFLHPRMEALLGNSHAVVDQLLDEGAPPENTFLIYNGYAPPARLPTSPSRNLRKSLGVSDGALVLTMTANLIPYKGHADLLNALDAIKNQLPKSWPALLVGRDDGIGAALIETAQNMGISDHIVFLGSRTDVAEILEITDIALLCSHEEGFSNAILEAMAAGRPIVATNVGGNGESILHNQTGLLAPPGDPAALGQAILELSLDPSKRQIMGVAGLKRFSEMFTLEKCVSQYQSFYSNLLRRNKAKPRK
jgi:glycosyltransferase involved in cell wall biosynthesis